MPSDSANDEAFDVKKETNFGMELRGDILLQWDMLRQMEPRIATDYITEELRRTGCDVTWEAVYTALTKPL